MADRSPHRPARSALPAVGVLAACAACALTACASPVIEGGRFLCADDADCAWGWQCLPLGAERYCVHPSAPRLPGGEPGPAGPADPRPGLLDDPPRPAARCGDGRPEPGEQCDAGALNSLLPDAPCRPDCRLPRCGDGVKDVGEACDDDSAACDALTCALRSPSRLDAHPPALRFGSLGLDAAQPARAGLALYNPTARAQRVVDVALVGCSAELALEPTPELGLPIAPGAAQSLSVLLAPQVAGLKSCLLRVEATDGQLLVPITAAVSQRDRQTDRFLQQEARRVDILFVVDPRERMTAARKRIAAAAPAFAAVAAGSRTDFHLASTASVAGPLEVFGQLQGDPRFVSRESARSAAELASELRTRIDLPVRGGSQLGLDALLRALSPELTASVDPSSCQACRAPDLCAAGGCRKRNWGFRRPNAALELVVLTDAPDASTASVRQVYAGLRELADPLLGNPARIHGLLPAADCAAQGTTPWDELIRVTGGARFDLCGAPETAARGLAQQLFGPARRFFLTRAARAATIAVEVDGRALAAGSVAYDAASNSVLLAQPPAEGALISVRYEVDQ